MNIRKIIREEVNDFEWIKDINPLDHIFNGRVFIDNDTDDKHMVDIQNIMFKYGYKWSGHEDGDEDLFKSEFTGYIAISSGDPDDYDYGGEDDFIIGYYSEADGYYDEDKKHAKRNGKYYKASHILSLYNIL